MSGKTSTTLTFHIHLDGAPVRTETLHERVVKVGKLPSSHLRIEHDDVSRMHAVVEVTTEGEVFVVDLGSATGTFVNQRRVNKARLSSGDELSFGGVRVGLELGAGVAGRDAAPPIVEAGVGAPARPLAPEAPVRATSSSATLDGEAAARRALLPNPFEAPVAAAARAADDGALDDDANMRWGIAASGPPVNPAEVETGASAAEVMILWGEESALHVAHMSPPRSFFVGEGSPEASVDYAIGAELLGLERMPIVLEVQGRIAVVVPEGASGEVTAGAEVRTLEALAAEGKLADCAALAGARQLLLPDGATARVRWRGFSFVTRSTAAGKAIGSEMRPPSWASHTWTALSLGVHAALISMFYFMPPSSASLSLDLENDPSRLVDYLVTAAEVVDEDVPTWLDAPDESSGSSGEAHAGDSGAMGDPTEAPSTGAYAVEGPPDNPDPHLARETAVEAARSAGAIGALAALSGSWASPTSPFGADTALGVDPMSALGALMGDHLGANFGFGGLGPNGTGRGGGGLGTGTIGVGGLGPLGHGCRGVGASCGGGPGVGDGLGTSFHGPTSHTPRIRVEDPRVVGGLSREVIRRTVRRHVNEVRFCYEQELRGRPDLAGRVTVSFIIAPNGAVSAANVATTTLSNARVESCITTAVRRWTFPAPDGGGPVGVTYPFVLESAE